MTVEQLKSQRGEKENSFNAYAKRRNAIRNIINKIDDKLDDDISGVNRQISNCILELQQGLKGTSQVTTICSDMEDVKEKGTGLDSKISSCRSNLSSEVRRCQSRIDTLVSEIESLENQIRVQGGTIHFWE